MANYTIIDDRDEADVEVTAAFVIATDSWMSGTGVVPGRSIVARPIPRERTARVCRSSDGKNHWYYVVDTEELMRVRKNCLIRVPRLSVYVLCTATNTVRF